MRLSGYSYLPLHNQKQLDTNKKTNTLNSSASFTSINNSGKKVISPITQHVPSLSRNIQDNSEYSQACKAAWDVFLEESDPAKMSKIKNIITGVIERDHEAQNVLGNIYYNEKKNFKLAKYWYEQSAKQGNDLAQYTLGTMHYLGVSVKPDHGKARFLFIESAEQGNCYAKYMLGCMNIKGEGGVRDYKLGKELIEQSAKQGYDEAKYMLGFINYKGLGVDRDLQQAKSFFTEAANENHGYAQYYLGNMHLNGEGMPKDTAGGIYWLKQAAKNGVNEAEIVLEKLGA